MMNLTRSEWTMAKNPERILQWRPLLIFHRVADATKWWKCERCPPRIPTAHVYGELLWRVVLLWTAFAITYTTYVLLKNQEDDNFRTAVRINSLATTFSSVIPYSPVAPSLSLFIFVSQFEQFARTVGDATVDQQQRMRDLLAGFRWSYFFIRSLGKCDMADVSTTRLWITCRKSPNGSWGRDFNV